MSDSTDWKARFEDLHYRNNRGFQWEDRTRSPQIAAQRDALLAQLNAANETIRLLIEQNTELATRVGEAFGQSDKDRAVLILEGERHAERAAEDRR